jgi:hypothetical protein
MLGAMMLRPSLVVIAASLLLAACGGSSHSSTGTRTATAAGDGLTRTVSITRQKVSHATTTTTSSTSAPPEVPKAKKEKHHGRSHAVSQGVHVETGVTVAASGDVSPSVVSIPSGVGVEIHVANHGSSVATVALGVPGDPIVHVAPGASATLHTDGLKDGTYRILVNDTPRGQLIIGAQGGP